MPQIEFIARAVIVRDGNILLARHIYPFLPGGHIEFGESAKDALKRELLEELGIEAKVGEFLAILEYSFSDDDGLDHSEINILFLVDGDFPKSQIYSRESHIKFFWHPINDLSVINLKPSDLKRMIPEIMIIGDRGIWRSDMNNEVRKRFLLSKE